MRFFGGFFQPAPTSQQRSFLSLRVRRFEDFSRLTLRDDSTLCSLLEAEKKLKTLAPTVSRRKARGMREGGFFPEFP